MKQGTCKLIIFFIKTCIVFCDIRAYTNENDTNFTSYDLKTRTRKNRYVLKNATAYSGFLSCAVIACIL